MKTETEKRPRRGWVIWLVIVLIALGAVVLAFFADATVSSWVGQHSIRSLRRAARLISHYGDWPTHVALGAVLIVIAWIARRRDWTRIFLAMLLACALAGLMARAVKFATGRARPKVKTEIVWSGIRFDSKHNAFPSGHTACSAGFFGALFLARRRLGAPLLIIPVLVAAARVYIRAHYLSDVTFALILGFVCALAMNRWFQSTSGSRSKAEG